MIDYTDDLKQLSLSKEEIEDLLPTYDPKEVKCLRCGKLFMSPDHRRIRRCKKCKAHPDPWDMVTGDNVWLTGDVILDAYLFESQAVITNDYPDTLIDNPWDAVDMLIDLARTHKPDNKDDK